MECQNLEDRRLAALCKSLDKLWSEDDVIHVKESISEGRLESVICSLLELGLFSFSFKSEAEKQKVLDSGPWSLSSNLLVLQQCDPDTPEMCYEFTHYPFWVHLYGLPFRRVSNEIVRETASKLAEVIDVKLETKGNSNYKVGKARVVLNLANPLKTGIIINLGKKNLWIEFKYERLPLYCYSCSKIRHYAMACKEIS
ncbi:hypothetical protein EUGRSUZ_L02110 [Eucalyptus grandis]|uniref:Zinc knuckle CX2CX4HX4C domain-containing protein n=1 Tax=Eucalyptus grandis TaxID=71139 RepID=A0A058ZTQ8_EUCGR|nr:hypothetical protein EUGRSUZ_L02110 [Eucalyptus grandis]